MSYNEISPSYYQLLQPQDAWHAGTPGWKQAPYPSFANNPNLVGPQFQAMNGIATTSPVKFALAAAAGLGLYYLFRPKKQRRNHRRNGRWSTAYKNKLPDSAFFVVESGGHKEVRNGKTYTVPKSKRKLPYKNLQGTVDLPHLRNAISRAPQTDIPVAEAKRVQKKARAILRRAS